MLYARETCSFFFPNLYNFLPLPFCWTDTDDSWGSVSLHMGHTTSSLLDYTIYIFYDSHVFGPRNVYNHMDTWGGGYGRKRPKASCLRIKCISCDWIRKIRLKWWWFPDEVSAEDTCFGRGTPPWKRLSGILTPSRHRSSLAGGQMWDKQ